MALDVHLKVGAAHDPGVQAWVLDLQGFATWAPTEGEALERMPGKVEEHVAWLRDRGGAATLASGPVRVVERVQGDEVLFSSDRAPASVEEIRETAWLLEQTRSELLHVVAGLSPACLDWSPPYRAFPSWASWRTVRQVVEHVALTEVGYYLPCVGHHPEVDRPGPGDWEALLERTRHETLRFLAGLEGVRDRVRFRTHGGEEWTLRKVLRRLVWHERLHTKSIRRIVRAFGR